MDVLIICVLEFTVFCIVCTVFVLFHVCIFILIFFLSVLVWGKAMAHYPQELAQDAV